MLELRDLTKVYAKSTIKSVDSLSLTVKEGEIFGFLGPNGAGKTTVIKMITGVLQPTNGEVFFSGKSFSQNKLDIKRNIGYVPDNHAVYEKLTGKQYLAFMGEVYGVHPKIRQERAEYLLELLGLEKAVNAPIKSYSHGMKQKIVVVGALLHNPKFWILDEPLTGLDPQSSFSLKEHMRKHTAEGNIVFFSSHILDVAEKLCHRVGIISKGRLIAVGTMEELKDRYRKNTLEEVFLDITKREDATL
jgi:ABC-2 type transport system ATP-binding protein